MATEARRPVEVAPTVAAARFVEPAVSLEEVLTPGALEFVAALQHEFGPRRQELLEARAKRRERLRAGEMLDFLPGTSEIREAEWKGAPVPA